ncbi:MAG: hypothetical protein N4A46_11240 [Schleiferiaceae bacterium]|nr:hypothetical protein [Schleiferiaceae bacterium]
MTRISVFLLLLFFSISSVFAQEIALQKTHPVSKDDKKGYIQTIDANDDAGEIYVVYRINDGKKNVTFHTYTFDLDFNLKGDELETYEYEKVPKEKQPKKYEGDYFEIEGLHVEPTMMYATVLKKKVTKYRWSWWQLG